MLTKIDDIVLYTAIDWNETVETDSVKVKKLLDSNGVKHTFLNYADLTQHEDVFTPLRTWRFENVDGGNFDFQSFPFLMYTEIHDDIPPSQYPKILLHGASEILDSSIVDLYKLGRS